MFHGLSSQRTVEASKLLRFPEGLRALDRRSKIGDSRFGVEGIVDEDLGCGVMAVALRGPP